jgi:protein tyrosine/serine phosphatase
LATSLVSYVWSQDLSAVKISNFGKVDENYYRGAQPKSGAFAQLKQLGVKTVVDLQEDGKSDEPQWAKNAGLQYFKIPLSSKQRATDAQTRRFLDIVNDPANLPVFVHCAGGRHRTGEMTAIYRITHDLWSADQAYAEMKRFDFYSFGGHGSLKDYVYQYFGSYSANQALTKAGYSAKAGAPAAKDIK